MTLRLGMMMAALAFLLVACGGGGDDGDEETPVATASPAATADAFDPAILTAFVLAPAEIPQDLTCNGNFNPPGNPGIGFALSCEAPDFTLVSQAVRLPDAATRPALLTRLRQTFSAVAQESTFDVPGSDQAFVYLRSNPPSAMLAYLIIKDEYVLNGVMQSAQGTQKQRAEDRPALEEYARITFGRLQQYLADPSSVSPVAGVTYATPTAGAPASATATPVPATP